MLFFSKKNHPQSTIQLVGLQFTSTFLAYENTDDSAKSDSHCEYRDQYDDQQCGIQV